jgi:hypothetical protein
LTEPPVDLARADGPQGAAVAARWVTSSRVRRIRSSSNVRLICRSVAVCRLEVASSSTSSRLACQALARPSRYASPPDIGASGNDVWYRSGNRLTNSCTWAAWAAPSARTGETEPKVIASCTVLPMSAGRSNAQPTARRKAAAEGFQPTARIEFHGIDQHLLVPVVTGEHQHGVVLLLAAAEEEVPVSAPRRRCHQPDRAQLGDAAPKAIARG